MELIGTLALLKKLFAWRAMIDIIAIAAIFFFLYRTLLHLGTWKIVTGILVALSLFIVAQFLNLQGIEWIFSNLSQVAVIALIVIFQPEIRKIFERAVTVKRSKKSKWGLELGNIVIEAVHKLAQRKQGALVVFPGKDSIQEWLSGGYRLDAKPSIPLILSIFDPSSPGHDGALIIEGNNLSQFGVRLPISQSSTLASEYGTRHHAAMGLAEKSDALTVVVSEERGTISVFLDGKMIKIDHPEKLKKTILAHLKATTSYPTIVPKGPARWPIFSQMAASIALAVLFWSTLIVSQGEMIEKVVSVPLEYTASPPNLVLTGDKLDDVRLHLTGQKSDLNAINFTNLSVKIDLAKAVPGKQTVIITGENIRLPRGVELLNVTPLKLELFLAEILEQEVTIKPQLVGQLPDNVKIQSVDVMPKKIKILSPFDDRKKKISSVLTTPIYLESISESTKIYCKIIAPPAIQPLDKRWPDVEVTITLDNMPSKDS